MQPRYALITALALCLLPLGARADERAELRAQVERQLETLRHDGDLDQREAAVDALVELGPRAKPLIQEALGSLDPELRFYLLFVLQSADVTVERLVRQIVEGHKDDSGTYPSALEARRELQALPSPDKMRMLVRIARRYGADASKRRNGRYVGTALDLLWELIRDADELPPQLPAEMASLCEQDLGDGFFELSHAFSFLPVEQALPALRKVLAEGSPLARARAARVLAEFLPASHAAQAVPLLGPLLTSDDERQRLAALIALDTLPLGDEAMMPVVALLLDKSRRVAHEALRIAGERRLVLAREAAEKVARGPEWPLNHRLEAVRTLGLLAQPESREVLEELVDPAANGRELTVLSAWALGTCKAPGSDDRLLKLVQQPLFAQEDPLYYGLARHGGADGLAVLSTLLNNRMGTGRAVMALSRCRDADRARAVTELERFVELSRMRPGDHKLGTQALGDLAARFDQEGPSREQALQALARLYLSSTSQEQKDDLTPIMSRVGGPKDAGLRAQLTQALVKGVTSARLTRTRREQAADALARVNPAQALAAIRSQLPMATSNRSDSMRDYARSLARSLARAGDSSKVAEIGLPYSRDKVEESPSDQRAWRQNDVGIDLLYAKQLDEAILEFRRMLWCRSDDYIASYNIACGYSLAGQVDESLRYLRRSVRHGYDDPRHMRTDTDLDSLHADRRFQRLVRRMFLQEETGLPRPDESWPRADDDE